MNLYRKHALAGLAATGIVAGALAGGGVAVASTGPAPSPTPTATAPAPGQCGYGHMHRMWHGHHTVMTAIAGYLGLSEAQLRSQLESGKSLADVARAQGKPVAGLEKTILAAVTTQVNAATGLSAAQKAAAISRVQSHLGEIVNMTCPAGMSGHPTGSPMPGPSMSHSPMGTMPGM
jgi:hypothetical protein